jgi:hypothetical protein
MSTELGNCGRQKINYSVGFWNYLFWYCRYFYRIRPLGFDSSGILIDLLYILSHLSGVVISVLVTGPKGHGFKPGQGDGFLRVIKHL